MQRIGPRSATVGWKRPCLGHILAMAFLVSWVFAEDSLALPGPKERWVRLSSPNFVVYSSAGRLSAKNMALNMEQLRAVLERLSRSEVRSPVPTKAYIFRNSDTFSSYSRTQEGSRRRVAGYFLRGHDANYIAVNSDPLIDAKTTQRIIYHEFIHEYLRNNFPELPLWFNEGFAEYYSNFSFEGKRVEIGQPILRHVRWLEKNSIIPLERLFAIDHDSSEYNENTRAGVFYAQSWALVHYLFLGNPEREGQIIKFLDLLNRGTEQDEAFREAFAADYSELQKELKKYLRRDFMPYRHFKAKPLRESSIETQEITREEALVHLGDLLSHLKGRQDSAQEHYEAAVEIAPQQASAFAGLGYLAVRSKSYQDAVRHYAVAVGHSPEVLSGRHAAALGSVYEEAIRLLNAGEFESAIPVLEGLALILEGDADRRQPILQLLDEARRRAPGS